MGRIGFVGLLAAAFLSGLPGAAFPQQDTNYYVTYPDMLGLGYFEALHDNVIRIKKRNPADTTADAEIEYRTNGNSIAGFIFSYDKIFVSLGFLRSKADPDKGKSKNTNLAVLLKGNRLVLEGYWRNFTGYYDDNTFGYRPYLLDTVHYFTNPGMNNRTFKLKGLYFLRPEKFSFNAAYYGACRQLKSAASWLLIGNVYTGRIVAPGGLIPYYAHDQFESYGDLERFRVTGFSAGGGWTANVVLFKRFFFNILLTMGAEPQWRSYGFTDGRTTQPFHISASSDLRTSVGFNSRRFYLIVTSVNDRTYNLNNSIDIQGNFLSVTFSLGYRVHFDNKATRWLKGSKIYQGL